MRRITWCGLTLSALMAGALPAGAEILLDYRDEAFLSGSPFYSASERRTVQEALAQAPDEIAQRFADEFVIRGDAAGSFTAPGADERVFLIQEQAAVAAEPFPDEGAPVLLVLGADGSPSFHALPDDVQYQRLVAAADTDGDGRDEVFLESSSRNMGEIFMSLTVASIGEDGTAQIGEILREVYVDSCEDPSGEGERTASTVSVADGITTESFTEPCP